MAQVNFNSSDNDLIKLLIRKVFYINLIENKSIQYNLIK